MIYQLWYHLEQKLCNSIKLGNIILHPSVSPGIVSGCNIKPKKIGKEMEDDLRERFLINSDSVLLTCTIILLKQLHRLKLYYCSLLMLLSNLRHKRLLEIRRKPDRCLIWFIKIINLLIISCCFVSRLLRSSCRFLTALNKLFPKSYFC